MSTSGKRQPFDLLLAGVVLVVREVFRYTGWPVPLWLYWLMVPLVIYLMLETCGILDLAAKEWNEPPEDSSRANPIKAEPPSGYTGAFCNKPSAEYLEAQDTSSAEPSKLAPFLLLIPFGVIGYLLLRY